MTFDQETQIFDLNDKIAELETDIHYNRSLLISYEGKLSRVEPLSDEFEVVVKSISVVKRKLEGLSAEVAQLRLNRNFLKLKWRNDSD